MVLGEQSVLSREYLVGAVLALSAIWAHRYPPGIDLPQHAHLFQMLAHYGDPESGYRFFYNLDFFTPYALLYLLAWPLTKLFGALVAVKALLTLATLATPVALHRWLRSVSGETRLAPFGFLLALGFAYLWGFLSMVLAMPVALFYLASVEELRRTHARSAVTRAAALAVALFFCHGITFGVAMVAGGIACVMQRRLRNIVIDLVHFVPATLIVVVWHARHQSQSAEPASHWPGLERVTTLFSGAFSSEPEYRAAIGGLLITIILFAVGRPRLSFQPARLAPVAVSLLCLFALPESLFDTWLVGSRFVHYVNCFALGALEFHPLERGVLRFRHVVLGIVVLSLLSLNVRLRTFNEELAGLDVIEQSIPPRSDLRIFPSQHESAAFGGSQVGQAGAWLTADRGGFLENDSARYFQIPLRRRPDLPWPREYRFLVARGTPQSAASAVGKGARLVTRAGGFSLFEAKVVTKVSSPGLELVRFGQEQGGPRQNRSAPGKPLTIDGRTFEAGIGIVAPSVLEMERTEAGSHLRGRVGIDDGQDGAGAIVFRVMDHRRKVLWTSGVLGRGEGKPFDVSLDGVEGHVFLMATPVGADRVTGDWADISVGG